MKIINSFLLLFIAARPAGAAVADKIIAKVNGKPIKLSEYERNKKSVLEQYSQIIPGLFSREGAKEELNKKVLDQMIDDELLKQEAGRLKIKVYDRELDNAVREIKRRFSRGEDGRPLNASDSEKAFLEELDRQGISYEEFRERIRNQLLTKKLISREITRKMETPSEKEIRKYYDMIKSVIKGGTDSLKGMPEEERQMIVAAADKFKEAVSERIRLYHIFIKAPEDASFLEKNKAFEKAKELKARIDKGADFEDLAAKFSDDKESAAKGGDLGYIVKGVLPEKLEKKAFSMRVGETAGPIKTKFGYHVIKLQEKRAPLKFRYDLAKDDIAQLISSIKFNKALLAYVKKLKEKADIKIFSGK